MKDWADGVVEEIFEIEEGSPSGLTWNEDIAVIIRRVGAMGMREAAAIVFRSPAFSDEKKEKLLLEIHAAADKLDPPKLVAVS